MSSPEFHEDLFFEKALTINMVHTQEDFVYLVNTDRFLCMNIAIIPDGSAILLYKPRDLERPIGEFEPLVRIRIHFFSNISLAKDICLDVCSKWAGLPEGMMVEEHPGFVASGSAYDLIHGNGSWNRLTQEEKDDIENEASLIYMEANSRRFYEVKRMMNDKKVEQN